MLAIETIRYMGTKAKLISYIIPAIKDITPINGIVCDIMAGSNIVSYALKKDFTVFTNDVQQYSYTISKAFIENNEFTINKNDAKKDLEFYIEKNMQGNFYHLFLDTYSNTYFSKEQCKGIDSIRYAIDQLPDNGKKYLYLVALMCAMSKVESSPGHFAQYMPATNKRIIPLQAMNIVSEFYQKCDNYNNIYNNRKKNKCFCDDYKNLLKEDKLKNVNTIYLDSPYSQEQYSRFYHILETLVKYDYPKVEYKAKYRTDRFMSDFCYKNKVEDEFKNIISYCSKNNINLLISYSNKGILGVEKLMQLCKQFFEYVELKDIDYKHSTQGKGSRNIKELLIKCKCKTNTVI